MIYAQCASMCNIRYPLIPPRNIPLVRTPRRQSWDAQNSKVVCPSLTLSASPCARRVPKNWGPVSLHSSAQPCQQRRNPKTTKLSRNQGTSRHGVGHRISCAQTHSGSPRTYLFDGAGFGKRLGSACLPCTKRCRRLRSSV